MTSLKQLFKQNQAALTVYYPDCIQSRLWGNLDQKIVETTGFQVGYRQWIYHDFNSINRFYSSDSNDDNDAPPAPLSDEERMKRLLETPLDELQHGHLFARLMLSGPALLTIWHGDNAIETLLALKGKTHPALAESNTIRGGFWCDNPTCNLSHSSDDDSEAVRELLAIGLGDLLENPPVIGQVTHPRPIDTQYVAHSGIVIICNVLNRVLATMGTSELLVYEVPSSADSKETMQTLIPVLKDAAQMLAGHPLAEFIQAYLVGDLKRVSEKMAQMPVTQWEYFVIQSATLSRDKWLAQNL